VFAAYKSIKVFQ